MKNRLRCREHAGRVYYGAVLEAKKEIPVCTTAGVSALSIWPSRSLDKEAASSFIYRPALSDEDFAARIGVGSMTSRRQLFSGLVLLLPSNFRGSWFLRSCN